MICRQCNEKRHYGPCCGYEPDMALGFCSSSCLTEYVNTHEITNKQLAGLLYTHQNSLHKTILDKVMSKKEVIANELFDMILNDKMYTKDYDL